MSLDVLEEKLGRPLPKEFRHFIEQHPDGYIPKNQYYITEHVGDRVQKFYSIKELWSGWENTVHEPYMKDEETLIIAELLGTDAFTLGIGKRNADIIYFLDWHMGLTPIASSINELLSLLTRSPDDTIRK